MGELIRTFTLDRNAFRDSEESSADNIVAHMRLARDQAKFDSLALGPKKTASNNITALATYVGVLAKTPDLSTTDLGKVFLGLYEANRRDAFRWLATRTLAKFVVPNGTVAKVNEIASELHASFSFFDMLLRLLVQLDSHSGSDRFLYFDELVELLNDDANWSCPSTELYARLLSNRSATPIAVENRRHLLEDLENEYQIPRDNFNGIFNKLLPQTGLFDTTTYNNRKIGIGLSSRLDSVLRTRVRFLLDNPPRWDPLTETWPRFLDLHDSDLPLSLSPIPPEPVQVELATAPLEGLVGAFIEASTDAGLQVSEALVLRFAASLLAKRFLILTGLSGSGKTKLAQAFARWMNPASPEKFDCFQPGSIVASDRISYFAKRSDDLSVELWNDEDEAIAVKVLLPRELIDEWAGAIGTSGFSRDTSARTIREAVAETTRYSSQLNSFETHLKAAAFAQLDAEQSTEQASAYEVVAVGADWTANDQVLGYADALDPARYVRTATLDLILRAKSNPTYPHFLILDEMNLSHVERYFADFLSAIESGEPLRLFGQDEHISHTRSGVPATVQLPPNLFVIGTVNVDETTYMFSPKVLDRANVIEFRVEEDDLNSYLSNIASLDLSRADGRGVSFATGFAEAATVKIAPWTDAEGILRSEVSLLFKTLATLEAEFGYRTVSEIDRFVRACAVLIGEARGDADLIAAIDAQIAQKVLPKLNGSRRSLEPKLRALSALCFHKHIWESADGVRRLSNSPQLFESAVAAARFKPNALNPLDVDGEGEPRFPTTAAFFKLSYDKLCRMSRLLDQNGFTSFAEA